MSGWLFGASEPVVDLSPAEKVIRGLTQDRDALQDQATRLQERAFQQQARKKELLQALEKAQKDIEHASAEAERAQELARETTVEIHVAERRIAQTAPVFAELEALREIVDHVELARAVLFPPQLVVAGPPGVGKSALISLLLADREWRSSELSSYPSSSSSPPFSAKLQVLRRVQQEGKAAVIETDFDGAKTIAQSRRAVLLVWVQVPSLKAIAHRLSANGLPEHSINHLIRVAQEDTAKAAADSAFFDLTITNEDLPTAFAALKVLICRSVSRYSS